jgi:SAM-dependent methyltransferase
MTETEGTHLAYAGTELELFSHATNWKRYWVTRLSSYVSGDVLEVGAGAGTNTRLLRPLSNGRYLCIEPDANLAAQLTKAMDTSGLRVEVQAATVQFLPVNRQFDTAIYIDVLEHIEDDSGELENVARHMRPGGKIIVLSPAHQALYSPFDASIGHFRRYNSQSLRGCTPVRTQLIRLEHLDALGCVLSLCNRVLLRQAYPTLGQILLWDQKIVPLSRRLDPITGFRFGKSILGVWEVQA